jgi:serine protease Do
VIEDIKILEAVERYISGQMTPDERVHFEQLRKSNPEVDQAVVEHSFFLQQLGRFDDVRKLKATLNDTHIHLAEKGLIKSPRLKGGAKVVYLFNRYKRTAMIAASIAGITALTISALVVYISPSRQTNQEGVTQLKRYLDTKIAQVHKENRDLNAKIEDVKDQANTPPIDYKSGGTGFLIDAKGYLVTNAHVVKDAQHVAVQANNGNDLIASIVFTDELHDIAILKITDKAFKAPASLPYSIKRSGGTDLAEPIFTLGYPRNDIVYGAGYISATTGFNGDTLACQIDIRANRGNSGSPILNRNGEVIGVISNKQNNTEGAVFAIHSKYIFDALNDLQKQDTTYKRIKLPLTSSNLKGKDRPQQVETVSHYVYMVKVD